MTCFHFTNTLKQYCLLLSPEGILILGPILVPVLVHEIGCSQDNYEDHY